ncbi:acyl-CoA thioesterase [Litorivivens lipolytica]|uniref:Acyl-CoA thioesterase n=1 Tax=Litorivivens lipolytica TaxID=1524264 RepID=A0A7W4Z6Q5_9GAMM|nr:thioesterase family protein [Litorivivens lipolytica]MBB3047195.1 acyl-CoA thioesterase [Litorivivens lipolytica]
MSHSPSPQETAFNQLLSGIQPLGDGIFRASIDASWLQGRTAFGGLSTSLVFEAMRQQVEASRQLRTLSVSFVGPAPAGDHRVVTRVLREGGSVTHMQGELLCDGEVAVSVNAAFGKARQSSIQLAGPALPPLKTADDSEPFPYIEGVTPEFTRHYDMRLEHGAMPFSGADSADFGMWLRFREAQPLTLSHLIALGDVPPMPGLNMIKPPGVGSSLSWYVELPSHIPDVSADNFVYYEYRCQAAGDGYYNNVATLWTEDGQPLMFGRQVATVFER